MKYFSMFTGIGGFELGIQLALSGHTGTQEETERVRLQDSSRFLHSGHPSDARCVGYSEIDKYAIQTFETNFGKEIKNYGDATTINTSELPDFDLLVGGFPCQAFSVAGKRMGFEDARGTLFFDVARVLRDKRPRYFILENVKGLLSHDGGKTFAAILEVLTDTGYDVSWSIHNSKNYGVPQNRERVYLIGNLRGERRPQVFPLRQAVESGDGPNQAEKEVHTGTLTARQFANWSGNYIRQINDPKHSNNRVFDPDGIAPTLNTMQGGNRQPFIVGGTQAHQKPREDGVSPTLTSAMGSGGGHIPILLPHVKVVSATKQGYEEAEVGDGINIGAAGSTTRRGRVQKEASQTLNTSGDVGTFDGLRVRKLTPVECERLQGFPDNWTTGSETQRYKQCGNAITVNVVQHVIKELLK